VPFVAEAAHDTVMLVSPGVAVGTAGAEGYGARVTGDEGSESVPVPPMVQGLTVKV
jgi:hypothetical protein